MKAKTRIIEKVSLSLAVLVFMVIGLGLGVAKVSQKEAVVGNSMACTTCSIPAVYGCSGNSIVVCKGGCLTTLTTCSSGYKCQPGKSTCVPLPCTWGGTRCSGKSILACKAGVVTTIKTCPSTQSCSAGNTSCVDNCIDGRYRCPTSGFTGYISKCVNDAWVSTGISGISAKCFCTPGGTSCSFQP